MILRGEQQGPLEGILGQGHPVHGNAPAYTEDLTPARFVQDGKVLRGKDGWLFLAGDTNDVLGQHTGDLRLDQQALEHWRVALEGRRRMASEIGARFLFAIVPDTHAIYREKLPDHVQPSEERPVVSLCKHLRRAGSPVEPIYFLDELRRASRKRLVCFPVDTHWNEYGAFVGYSRIADEIEKFMPVRRIHEEELILFESPMIGDLSYKLDPARHDTMTFAFVRNGSAILVEDNRIEGSGSVVQTHCPDATGSCLLLGDSYGWGMVKPLAESFRDFTFLHMPTFDLGFIAERKPDVIVNLIAERFLMQVPVDEPAASVRSRIAYKRSTDRVRDNQYYWIHAKTPALESVERMRATLLSEGRVRDAAIVSLLAYVGLQPAEIVSMRWRQIEGDRLTVAAATKPWLVERIPVIASFFRRYRLRRVRKRIVPLVDHVLEDIERWRSSLERPPEPRDFVFPTADGDYWPRGHWKAWRSRVYKPLVKELGVRSLLPYDCRHVYSTLLINAGITPSELAWRLGTTAEKVRSDYGLVFHYASKGPPVPVADQIDRARRRADASVSRGFDRVG